MAIKNWTVTAESTKSAASREIYFNDDKHPNHKNTERIISVFGSASATANIIRNCEQRKLELALKGKGGRPPTEAMEFVLTLPKGIRPSGKQWQDMLKGVAGDLAKFMGMDVKEFNGIVRAVVHQQNQDKAVKGAGDHMHMMIGKFTDKAIYMPKLQQLGALHAIKMSFNMQVRNVMGVDHNTYVAEKNYKGVAKKRVPKWKVDAARARDAINVDAENAVSVLYVKELNKLTTYLDKILNAGDDVRQVLRQKNRFDKSIKAITEMTDVEGFKPSVAVTALTDQLNQKIDSINQNSKMKVVVPKIGR